MQLDTLHACGDLERLTQEDRQRSITRPSDMPAGGGALSWLRDSLSRTAPSILVIIACKTLLFRVSYAFRPSTVLLESSVLLEPRASCDAPTVEISGDGRDSSATVQLEHRDTSGLVDDAGDTREGFLRGVVGVGLGLAAGSVCEAEPANALFGEGIDEHIRKH